MPWTRAELEALAEREAQRWNLQPALVKAVIEVESSWNPKARRYERKRDEKRGNGKDDGEREINASWGLMQLMSYTAVALGFPETWPFSLLYAPEINLYLGCKLLSQLIRQCKDYEKEPWHLDPVTVALARYNGGAYGNPRHDGTLRNIRYVNKVLKAMEAYL